jgi:hypothetical protein
MKFARPLKEMLRTLYREAGLSEKMIERKIEGDLKRTSCPILGGKTPTDAMQTLGDEWGRQLVCPDLWVNILGSKYRQSTATNVVVDDCRYVNEARTVRQLGGQLWKVVRNVKDPVEMNRQHRSETEQADLVTDWVLENDGGLLTLYTRVDEKLGAHV